MTEHSVMPKARNLAISFRDNILILVGVGPELIAKDLSQTVRTDSKVYQDKSDFLALAESQDKTSLTKL